MNNIREIRESKGMNQLELAYKSGLSTASISFYENNKNVPSMNNAYKIAQVLEVSIDDLFKVKEVIS